MKKLIGLILFIGLFMGCEKSGLLDDQASSNTGIVGFRTPADIYVPGDYSTIQEAVDAALDGQTILIEEGTYEEFVQITGRNDLTLIGENAIITPPLTGAAPHGNIEILNSTNIKMEKLEFDGRIDLREEPVHAALNFLFSSGEVFKNKIKEYHTGVATYNPDGALLNISVVENDIEDFTGSGIYILENYDATILKNKISSSFDHFLAEWDGIRMIGGTGEISENTIKLNSKSSSGYPLYSTGIYLYEGNPSMHDLTAADNSIKGTVVGFQVNEEGEGKSIYNCALLYNKFKDVEEPYAIYNSGVPIEIIP